MVRTKFLPVGEYTHDVRTTIAREQPASTACLAGKLARAVDALRRRSASVST